MFLLIEQVVIFGPTQDKASASQKGLRQPGIAGKATIPNMQNLLAPQLVDLIEDLGFFGAYLTGSLASGRPPMQVSQGGRAFVSKDQHL